MISHQYIRAMVQWIGSLWCHRHTLTPQWFRSTKGFLNPINHLKMKIQKKTKIKIYPWILACRASEAALPGTACREEYGMDWPSLAWLRASSSAFIWAERKAGLEGFERSTSCPGNKKNHYFDLNLVVGIGNADIWCFLALFYNFLSFFGSCKYINHHLNSIQQHNLVFFLNGD